MPRNGSGAYSLPEAAFVFDTVISETSMNSNLSDIASALTASIAADGQTTITANLPINSKKLTGLAVGTDQADSVTLRQVQAGAYCFVASDTGSADAYAIAPSPSIAAYAAGQKFSFPAANASTGASTLAVSALATKAIEYQGAALTGAEIKAGATIYVEYDGTAFQMISPSDLLGRITQNIQTGDYTTDLTDEDGSIYHPSGAGAGDTFTIDSNANVAYKLGTAITFVNRDTNDLTIAITSDTLTLSPDGTTGNRTLAQYGMATAYKETATLWMISGSGLT